MEFVTSVVGGKTPRDGRALSIALGLQDGMRWRKSCMLFTRRDKQPRAKILISIYANSQRAHFLVRQFKQGVYLIPDAYVDTR